MRRRNWILTGLLLVAALVALVGPTQARAVLAQGELSRVRFLHAVPGAPEVDVYMDGVRVVSGLGFGEVTPHLSVPAGDHQVALRAAGSDPAGVALVEVSVPLAANLAFMVVAQGSADAVQAALYEDILDEIAPGMARLTAINTIADSPALDVLTTAGGPLLQGVSYGAQFGTVNIGTGVQDLVFVPAGGSQSSPVAAIGQVPLTSGMLYTLVALGTIDGDVPPSTLVLASPVNAGADAVRVRIAHGSPDAPAVDIYAGDTLLVPALELGEMTSHIALPAGSYTFALRPAGSPAADNPVATADVTLDAGTTAVTVAALGQLDDGSLALQVFPDDVAAVTPEQARFSVINTVPGSTVTAALSDPAGTSLVSSLAANTQGGAASVVPGSYVLTVNIAGVDNPVDVVVPEQTYYGGTYYSVLVYGGGVTEVPYDASVAGTEMQVLPASLPGSTGEAVVAAAPTEQAPEATAAVEATAEAVAEAPTEAAAVPTEEVAAAVTPTPAATEAAQPPAGGDTELVTDTPTEATGGEVVQATPAPLVTEAAKPTAFVNLDPGANLQCRQYPRPDALSLGLIPSGATLTVLGRPGAPILPDTGVGPTPEPTLLATLAATPVFTAPEEMWLSVQWDQPDGGYIRCWVAARYLRVEFNGRVLDTLDELMGLPEEPYNRPGEAVNTTAAPPTPRYNAMLATVNLDPGVSLQLRRLPNTTAESLDRVPAGSQLEVLGYIVAPSEGLTGQPSDPNWVRVRYLKENGGATVGWVSAQYLTYSQAGHALKLEDLPLLQTAEPGFYETPGQQPQIPVEQQAVSGVVTLNPGANLNLRDRPSADALVVVAIPTGAVLTLIGRNTDGTWVQVTYEAGTSKFQGWVSAQYLTVTRGGQPYNVMDLPDVSATVAPQGAATPAVPTPTETPYSG